MAFYDFLKGKISFSKWSDLWKCWNCYIECSFFHTEFSTGRSYWKSLYRLPLKKIFWIFYLSENKSFMFEFLNIWEFENRIVNWIKFRIWKIMGLIKYSWWCPESSARIRIEMKYWIPTFESHCSYFTILYWFWYTGHMLHIFKKRYTVFRLELFSNDSIEANVKPCISQSYTAKPYGAWATFHRMFHLRLISQIFCCCRIFNSKPLELHCLIHVTLASGTNIQCRTINVANLTISTEEQWLGFNTM